MEKGIHGKVKWAQHLVVGYNPHFTLAVPLPSPLGQSGGVWGFGRFPVSLPSLESQTEATIGKSPHNLGDSHLYKSKHQQEVSDLGKYGRPASTELWPSLLTNTKVFMKGLNKQGNMEKRKQRQDLEGQNARLVLKPKQDWPTQVVGISNEPEIATPSIISVEVAKKPGLVMSKIIWVYGLGPLKHPIPLLKQVDLAAQLVGMCQSWQKGWPESLCLGKIQPRAPNPQEAFLRCWDDCHSKRRGLLWEDV